MSCKHRELHPEGAVLPDDVALEHFDQCFTPERRMQAWKVMREDSEVAHHCFMANHAGLLQEVRWAHDRIVVLSSELTARPRRKAARIEYRRRRRNRR